MRGRSEAEATVGSQGAASEWIVRTQLVKQHRQPQPFDLDAYKKTARLDAVNARQVMKHRNLNHNNFTSAAIDNIIERGLIPDWVPLMKEIERDPFGAIARKTLAVCENHQVYGGTAVFQSFIEQSRLKSVSRPVQTFTP